LSLPFSRFSFFEEGSGELGAVLLDALGSGSAEARRPRFAGPATLNVFNPETAPTRFVKARIGPFAALLLLLAPPPVPAPPLALSGTSAAPASDALLAAYPPFGDDGTLPVPANIGAGSRAKLEERLGTALL